MAKLILKLEIRANEGYDAAQVIDCCHTMTVGALREMLAEYDDETEIVTYDLNNRRGAKWGCIPADTWVEEIEAREFDEDEDDEE